MREGKRERVREGERERDIYINIKRICTKWIAR